MVASRLEALRRFLVNLLPRGQRAISDDAARERMRNGVGRIDPQRVQELIKTRRLSTTIQVELLPLNHQYGYWIAKWQHFLPLETQMRLLARGERRSVWELAQRKDLHKKIQSSLLDAYWQQYWHILAANKNISFATQKKLAETGNVNALSSLARVENLNKELLETIGESNSIRVLARLAMRDDLSDKLFYKLLNHPSPSVRAMLSMGVRPLYDAAYPYLFLKERAKGWISETIENEKVDLKTFYALEETWEGSFEELLEAAKQFGPEEI